MKTVTPDQAREKIRRYCAYQERSHLETRTRLYTYGLRRDDVDEIVSELITDGYLNEERFAKAFAGGKFRMKKWGRIKITHALEAKGVSPNCIKIGLKEIDDAAYLAALQNLVAAKLDSLDETNAYVLRDKLAGYAIQKGYEPELVWIELKRQIPKSADK
jgi:regulatory protein